MAGRGFRTGLL